MTDPKDVVTVCGRDPHITIADLGFLDRWFARTFPALAKVPENEAEAE